MLIRSFGYGDSWQVVDQVLSGNIEALLLDRDLLEADLFQVFSALESRMARKEVWAHMACLSFVGGQLVRCDP